MYKYYQATVSLVQTVLGSQSTGLKFTRVQESIVAACMTHHLFVFLYVCHVLYQVHVTAHYKTKSSHPGMDDDWLRSNTKKEVLREQNRHNKMCIISTTKMCQFCFLINVGDVKYLVYVHHRQSLNY